MELVEHGEAVERAVEVEESAGGGNEGGPFGVCLCAVVRGERRVLEYLARGAGAEGDCGGGVREEWGEGGEDGLNGSSRSALRWALLQRRGSTSSGRSHLP